MAVAAVTAGGCAIIVINRIMNVRCRSAGHHTAVS